MKKAINLLYNDAIDRGNGNVGFVSYVFVNQTTGLCTIKFQDGDIIEVDSEQEFYLPEKYNLKKM